LISKDSLKSPEYIKGALLRRMWYIALPFFVIATGAVLYCIKAPRVYLGKTLILVEPQKVPSDFVKSTVTMELADRLRTIEEQVKSRTKLEKIVNEQGLYPEIRATRTMTDAVEALSRNVGIRVNQSRSGASASFTITFETPDPAKARDVPNAVAALFIEDNLKLRESQAMGTTRFLDRELERMQAVLRDKEEQVRKFKENHVGLLPENMPSNYQILSRLQQQLDSINANLQKTEDRKVLLQMQLSRLETLDAISPPASLAPGPIAVQPAGETVEELRKQLQAMRSKYSDRHPDVIRLQASIDNLEKEPRDEPPPAGESPSAAGRGPRAHASSDLQSNDPAVQLRVIEKELATLLKEREKLTEEIARFHERIERGPEIEQKFVDIRRGYEEAYGIYQSLLDKRLQAQLSENLERAQQGEQFAILDPARAPERPFKPDTRKVLLMGFALALGGGLGLAYLREFLDPVLWTSKDLESLSGVPVLVSIPLVATRRERKKIFLKRVGAAFCLTFMATVLVYWLLVLYKKDPGAFSLPL